MSWRGVKSSEMDPARRGRFAFTYQIAAPFVFLSIFVYRIAGASWRRVTAPWVGAVVVGLVAVLYVKANLPRRAGSITEDFTHARDIAGAARHLLTSLGIQQVDHSACQRSQRSRCSSSPVPLPCSCPQVTPSELSFDAGCSSRARASCQSGAAYSIFISGDFYTTGSHSGSAKSGTNAAAALGFAIVLYSLLVLLALVVVRVLRLDTVAAPAVAIASVGTGMLLVLFVSAINSDRHRYERAAKLQGQALAVAKNDVARPPRGTTVYLFGIDGEIAPNVFTFVRTNDVTAALRLLWNDDTIEGVPVSSTAASWPGNTQSNSGISCGPQSVQPRGWLFWSTHQRPTTPRSFSMCGHGSEMIRSEASCRTTLSRYLSPVKSASAAP